MIYIFRHGQTDWNLEARFQGHKETSLNQTGILQAQQLASFFSKLKIDQLYVSPQKRAQQTASYLSKEFVTDNRLKEISFGDFEGFSIDEIKAFDSSLLEKRQADRWNFAFKNGESMAEVWKRALSFSKEFLMQKGNKNLGVLAHGGFNRILVGVLLKYEQNQILDIIQPNDVFYRIINQQLSYCRYNKFPHWHSGHLKK